MRFAPVLVVCALAATACGGSASSAETTPASGADSDGVVHGDFVSFYSLGMGLQESERCPDALEQGYDPAIRAFEDAHRGQPVVGRRTSAVRDTPVDPAGEPVDYADALYLAAFCSVEIGDLDRAEAYLRKALAVIEHDPLFQSELGHVQQARGQFPESIATFQVAVDAARALEGTDPGVTFLGMPLVEIRHRAMRGVGYSLGELRRFDEAERTYREILAEDPTDERSLEELRYIDAQRQQQPNHQ